MRTAWRRLAGCCLVAALALSVPALARHRSHANAAAPGDFDYYLLSLSWSPAFCLQAPQSTECHGARRYGFIVHGLWPQNERGWPENCQPATQLPESVIASVADIMPARSLAYHEWSKHGTCSGLDPVGYFALVQRAYDSVAIPSELTRPAAAIERAPEAIVAEFLKSNPKFQAQSVVTTCSGQGAPRLKEVHLCFDRNLESRVCAADVLRSACRAATVIVPPVR